MRRITLVIGLVLVFSLSTASWAVAAPAANDDAGLAAMEHRVPYDQQPFRVSDTRCGFFVDVTIVADREYIVRTVTNSDGTVTERVTGHLVETLTNVSDPSKSVTLNV